MLQRIWLSLAMIVLAAACTVEGAPRWPLNLLLGAEASAPTIDYTASPIALVPIVDARTGETFTLAEYAGKTIFVEPMATW